MERGPYKERIYTMEQILEFEQRIREGKRTIKSLMKEEQIGIRRLKKEFSLARVPFPKVRPGRKPSEITQDEIDAVTEYRKKFAVGYQKCAFALAKKNIATMSARKCASILNWRAYFYMSMSI